MQFLTPEMCGILSSIAPGFEGHWWWVKWLGKIQVMCWEQIATMGYAGSGKVNDLIISPAWQVEDVLHNAQKINLPIGVGVIIIGMLNNFGSEATAYQKIEEYLWTILK